MSPLENPRHELFAQEIAKGRSQQDAYVNAGYGNKIQSSTYASASRLIRNVKIATRIRQLQAETVKSTEATLSSLIAEAEQARALAETKGQPSAMVSATTLKAKLTGHLVERIEDLVKRDELEEQRARRQAAFEVTNAAKLLAQAAQALGLPLEANAQEIVVEASKVKYLPPPVQRLLHAAQRREELNDDN